MNLSYPQTYKKKYFPVIEILNFDDIQACASLPNAVFLPFQASELTSSISKKLSITYAS
jgi:hypothetical protein